MNNRQKKKLDSNVASILASTSVTNAGMRGYLYPKKCRICGKDMTELEKIKFKDRCGECAKRLFAEYRENALKKYVVSAIIIMIIMVAGVTIKRIDDGLTRKLVTCAVLLFVILPVHSVVIHTYKKDSKRELTHRQKRRVIGVLDSAILLGIVAFFILMPFSVIALAAVVAYAVINDVKGYNRLKLEYEEFDRQRMIDDRRQFDEDVKIDSKDVNIDRGLPAGYKPINNIAEIELNRASEKLSENSAVEAEAESDDDSETYSDNGTWVL